VVKWSAPSSRQGQPECTMFGFLQEFQKGDPTPDECISCQKWWNDSEKTPLTATVRQGPSKKSEF
jgi:hypothetical protein